MCHSTDSTCAGRYNHKTQAGCRARSLSTGLWSCSLAVPPANWDVSCALAVVPTSWDVTSLGVSCFMRLIYPASRIGMIVPTWHFQSALAAAVMNGFHINVVTYVVKCLLDRKPRFSLYIWSTWPDLARDTWSPKEKWALRYFTMERLSFNRKLFFVMDSRSNIIGLLISEWFYSCFLLHCLLQKGIGHLENKRIKLTIYWAWVSNLPSTFNSTK